MGECHYQVGNYDAMVTHRFTRTLLAGAGLSTERLSLEWASAAEAPLFVKLITAFTEKVRDLGPLGRAEGIDREDLMKRLAGARDAATDRKVRTRLGRSAVDLRKAGEYSEDRIMGRLEPVLRAVLKE